MLFIGIKDFIVVDFKVFCDNICFLFDKFVVEIKLNDVVIFEFVFCF